MSVTEADLDVLRVRLRQDWSFYAPRCHRIVNAQGVLVPFRPKAVQLKLWRALEAQRDAGQPQRAIILKARKTGISTMVQSLLIWRATLTPNHRALVVAQDTTTAGELFEMGQLMYAHLPIDPRLDLKPPVWMESNTRGSKFMAWGESSRILRNQGHVGLNSSLKIDTAKEYDAGRGGTPRSLHLSEVAFYKDVAKLLALLNSVPDDADSFIALESTANADNHFKGMWDAAASGESAYAPVFIAWHEEESYRRLFANDDDREGFIAQIGRGPYGEDEPMLQEVFGCTPEQLAWRRWTIINKCDQKLDSYKQEYPSCLTAEMRVSTDRGIVPICEASESLRTESGPIRRWGIQPPSAIYRLTTKQGRVLRGTLDHPVATTDGLVWLSRLRVGQRVLLRPPMFANDRHVVRWDGLLGRKSEIAVTKDLGRWIGYFMGDGSWHDTTIAFALDAKDQDVVADVARLTSKFVGETGRREIVRKQGRKGMTELRVARGAAREAMERLGLLGTNGSGNWRREVCVPECIWRSPRPVVREFLRGLFECDGSASAGVVRWASSRQQFARDVQLLLLGFGINALMMDNPKIAGSGHVYHSWVLGLNAADSRRFHDEIGFIGKRKRKGRKRPSGLGRPATPRPFEDEVVSVEADGFEATYDFTMDTEDHLFMANGIVTHNTPEEAFLASGTRVFSVVALAKLRKRVERTDPVIPAEGLPGPHLGKLLATGGRPVMTRRGVTIDVPTGAKFDRGARDGFWRVWEPPKLDGQYVVGVDAMGGEETELAHAAYHAIEIIDHRTLLQVAEYRSRIDPDELAMEVYLALLWYGGQAWVAPEVTGGWGAPVARRLAIDFRYPKVYRHKALLERSEPEGSKLGWQTSPQTKPVMEATAKELLRGEADGVRSRLLVAEMFTYIDKGRGRHGPERGKSSDLLIAWMVAQQVAREKPLAVGRRKGPVSTSTKRRVSVVSGY